MLKIEVFDFFEKIVSLVFAQNGLKRSVLMVEIFVNFFRFWKKLFLELWPKTLSTNQKARILKIVFLENGLTVFNNFRYGERYSWKEQIVFRKKIRFAQICPNLGLLGPNWARLDRKFEFDLIWSCYIPFDCKCHADYRFWNFLVKFAVLAPKWAPNH